MEDLLPPVLQTPAARPSGLNAKRSDADAASALQEMRMYIRLRLNKPAVDEFLFLEYETPHASKANCVTFRINNNQLALEPKLVENIENIDATPIHYTGRGSAEFVIDGNFGDEVRKALSNPYGNPFFRLLVNKNYIVAEPFKSDLNKRISSPRLQPTLKVVESSFETIFYPMSGDLMDMFTNSVLHASQVVKQSRQKGRLISPSNEEIGIAKDILVRFEGLAFRVLPVLIHLREALARHPETKYDDE